MSLILQALTTPFVSLSLDPGDDDDDDWGDQSGEGD